MGLKILAVVSAFSCVFALVFLSFQENEKEDTTTFRILNPNFQEKCIELGGQVYPTRYGYGGCMLDGYSYAKLEGVSFND